MRLDITPATARDLHYSQQINIRDIVNEFNGGNVLPAMHSVMQRLHLWHQEEHDARTDRMPVELAAVVIEKRGFHRNAIV